MNLPSFFRRPVDVLCPAIRPARSILLAGAAFFLVALGQGATLTWDASGANPGAPTGGAGTWSSTNANWSNGVSDSVWVNANNDSAFFIGNIAANSTVNLGEAIVVNSINFGGGGSASYTVSGGSGITITSGSVIANRSSTIQAAISGTNGLTKAGTATLTLFTANNYSGATIIQSGIVQPRATGALPAGTTVIIGATSANATLDVRVSQTVAGLSAAGTGTNLITNTQTDGTVTLTVNPDGAGGGAADSTFPGIIRDGSATRFVALAKAGSHTLTLSGSNSYTGATTVNAGTLLINGSLAAGSAVSVGASGTLGGNGTIGGSVSVLGALAPGNGIATLNTGSLGIGSTGALSIELGRSGGTPVSDRANVTGGVSLTAGADLELTLSSDNPLASDIFWLVSNDDVDAVTGVFTSLNGIGTTLTEGSFFTWNSQQWQITYTANFESLSFTGGNDIAIMAVPEPSASILIFLAGMSMCASRRRRF